MAIGWNRRTVQSLLPAVLLLALAWVGTARPAAQSVAAKETVFNVERALERLPYGTYPVHIIVKGGRTTLLGVVDNESDKTVAGLRAREVDGVFGVENELVVNKK